MSHSLPLPISAARASPGSALENLPESATKPAKVAFLFLPPPPHILLHPWAEMAPPGSARTDASLEKVLDWLLFNSARVRPTCSVKQPPLQHPVTSDWQRCAEWGLCSTQKSREATSHETALRARESGEVQNGQRKLGGPRGFSPRSSHQG